MIAAEIDIKQLIREYFSALSGQPKTTALLDKYISDAGLKEHIRQAEAAFPEYELIPIMLVAEGDLVAARCTFRGLQQADFAGTRPTGKPASAEVMVFYRIRDGKIAEHWIQMSF